MAYAKGTEVSVAKSQAEIQNIIMRYGATTFMFGQSLDGASIAFEAKGRRVQFFLPLPKKDERRFLVDGRNYRRTPEKQHIAWEQACREKWRSLCLCIKAKLEAVDAGITTFEDEFMAHIVMPDGLTVGQHIRPRIADAYESGTMLPMLPGPTQ